MLNEWLDLKRWSAYYKLAFLNEAWFIKVAIIFVIATIVHAVAYFMLVRMYRLSKLTQRYWDDIVVYAIRPILPFVIWLIGISLAFIIYCKEKQLTEALEIIATTRSIGLTFGIAWFFWRIIDAFGDKYIEEQQLAENLESLVDRTTIDAIVRIAHLIIILMVAVAIMHSLGFSITGLLAAGGMSGIILGFAAKDIFANVLGGLTIYIDRPFSVGDSIRSPEHDIEGTVELINWRHTRIRRFNKNPIYVPNALFSTIVVENITRMSHRRILEYIGLNYKDIHKLSIIADDIRSMLKNHPSITQQETLLVNFDSFNASSVDIKVMAYTEVTQLADYQALKQGILLDIAHIIEQHGAEIAFPTQTLHIASNQNIGTNK